MSRSVRRRRTIWTVGIIAVVLIAAGSAVWYLRSGNAGEVSSAEETEPVTAAVERTTLTNQVRLSGQLGYGDAVPLTASSGTITVLPTAGQVIATGQQVYEADGIPVVLFRGARPFWRELSAGSAAGEDIRQLQQNLSDLGFYRGAVDGRFAAGTAQAIRNWQKSLGMEQTGAFLPSSVVVADSEGIRISQVTAHLGDSGASPATYTETALRATAKLTDAQARELAVGTPVTVALPDGTEIEAALAAVDPGGQPTGETDQTTSPSATIEFPDQNAVTAVGAVAVRITIRDDSEQDVTLVVPATALLATVDGGYAVEVLRDGEIVRTTVAIGLVADARVQILASGADVDGGTGPALAEGDLVVLSR